MTYRVQLDLFEGPLDLLLHLIKKNEVDVTNIPVATITEQYLAYLDLMRELNLDIASEYLVMAATLTLLKSRLLLPAPETEEGEEADPRADLIRQLLEYQRYREAAASLGERPLLRRDVFTREPSAEGVPPDPDARHLVGVDAGPARRTGARPARSGAHGRGRNGVVARAHHRPVAHARRRSPAHLRQSVRRAADARLRDRDVPRRARAGQGWRH